MVNEKHMDRIFGRLDALLAQRWGWLALLSVMTLLYTPLFLMREHTSDDANTLLAGLDLVTGNPLLKGWYLPRNPYLLTDMLPYGLVTLVLGLGVKPLVVVPALLWAGVVTLSVMIQRRFSPQNRWGLLLLMTILALPLAVGERVMGFIGQSPMHVGTLLLGLFLMLLSEKQSFAKTPSRGAGWLFVGILVAGMLSDPFILFVGVLPIFAAYLTRRGSDRNALVGMAVQTGLALILSFLMGKVIRMLGGYETSGLPLAFVGFPFLSEHIGLLLEGILIQSGADFTGRGLGIPDNLIGLSSHPMVLLARLPLVFLIFKTVGFSLRRSLSGEEPTLLRAALGYGVLILALAEVFSTLLVDVFSTRYSIPLVVFATLLCAMELSAGRLDRILIHLAFWPSLVAFLFNLILPLRGTSVVPGLQGELVKYLVQEELSSGYGAYWDAGIITVASKGKTHLLPILETPDGRLVNNRWLAKEQVFKADAKGRGFFLVDHSSRFGGFKEKAVIQRFGAPDEIRDVDGYSIMVYKDKDLSLDESLYNNYLE